MTWLENARWLLHSDPRPDDAERGRLLNFVIAPMVGRWLDRTRVKGDPRQEAAAREALDWFDAWARFDDLTRPTPAGAVVTRLRGLV